MVVYHVLVTPQDRLHSVQWDNIVFVAELDTTVQKFA